MPGPQVWICTSCLLNMPDTLQDPPAVLAQRLPWGRTEEALALKFSRKERLGFAGLTMYWPASKGIQLARRWGVGSKSEKPLH